MKLTAFLLFCLSCCGCSSYYAVPPDYKGLILTPTGWEKRVYTPGQVDLGQVGANGMSNQLVLIKDSGVIIKETFSKANKDSEDHRVLTSDKIPLTLDVRLLMVGPELDFKDATKADRLNRMLTMANPKQKDGMDARVKTIELYDVYTQQAQLYVRSSVRNVVASYKSYDDLFDKQAEFGARLKNAIVSTLRAKNVPLDIVDVEHSNLKPDDVVLHAQNEKAAAQARVDALKLVGDFLQKNPHMRDVYKAQVLLELARTAAGNGHTLLYMTDLPGTQPPIVPK